jgi:hypothetical protein
VAIADEESELGLFVNGEAVENANVTSRDEVRLGTHILKMRVVEKRNARSDAAASLEAPPAADPRSPTGRAARRRKARAKRANERKKDTTVASAEEISPPPETLAQAEVQAAPGPEFEPFGPELSDLDPFGPLSPSEIVDLPDRF